MVIPLFWLDNIKVCGKAYIQMLCLTNCIYGNPEIS